MFEKEKIVKISFLHVKIHETKVNLLQLFTANLLLVVFILILRAFYLPSNFEIFIPYCIDVLLYAQIGQNFIENL